ncbi:MAG: hypothetical protein HKM94_01610 [Halobacteria archaeon]|nr:hypothetical protein [Halobacteria archaeon]
MLRLLFIFFLLGSVLTTGCSEPANHKSQTTESIQMQPATGNRVPGQYIVTLKEGIGAEILQKVFAEFGIKSVKDLSKRRYLMTLEKDPGPESIIKQAATSSDIEHVQPNYIYRTMQPAQEKPQLTR